MSLKKKSISGIGWNLTEKIISSGSSFVIGIILARILSPEDFGLIGMTTVIFAFANTFVDGGLSIGLIRKTKCTALDYDTVFIYNVCLSVVIYLLLAFFAPYIALFFNEGMLVDLIRVLALVILINSFSIVQIAILSRRIDFKKQTIASVVGSLVSGVFGIFLAYQGFGVWSLVYQILLRQFIYAMLIWMFAEWRPSFSFSVVAFKEQFKFSNKILLSNLIATFQYNIYYLVLGKFFSPSSLGYFTRAEQFNAMVTTNLSTAFSKVLFPALASIKYQEDLMLLNIKKISRMTFFVSFLLLTGLASVAKPLIHILLGARWETSILYLQLLCISSIFLPLNLTNLNILNIKGRSDLVLKLQVIKIVLLVPSILGAIYFGVVTMLVVRIFMVIIATYVNSSYSGRLVKYSVKEQMYDIAPYLLSCSVVAGSTFLWSLTSLTYSLMLVVQVFTFLLVFLLVFELQNLDEYVELKRISLSFIKGHRNKV
ncbi:lipopolysaccharide biosynthesis protein [uncultured Imperialibacter sp.]|uniref:lipopolysaccharide biosynthesis protein n=1 Tax=uncultured Imperialibacter sp. TaxID=1672639 RepID=UPI0030DD4A00|tara:strand:+ start:14694 stop:16145 length:1452 start_codon:yes stop_codon:yes gene_type:complete